MTAAGKVAEEHPCRRASGFGASAGALIETSNGSVVVTVNADDQHVGRLTTDGGFVPYRIAGLRGVAGFAEAKDGGVWVIGMHNRPACGPTPPGRSRSSHPGGESNGGHIASDRAGGAWTIVGEGWGRARACSSGAHRCRRQGDDVPLADNVAFFALAVRPRRRHALLWRHTDRPDAADRAVAASSDAERRGDALQAPSIFFIGDLAVTEMARSGSRTRRRTIGRFAPVLTAEPGAGRPLPGWDGSWRSGSCSHQRDVVGAVGEAARTSRSATPSSLRRDEARGHPPRHVHHRRRAAERRVLRRHARPAAREEDGEPGRPDRLPPLLRRRARQRRRRHHLLRVPRRAARAGRRRDGAPRRLPRRLRGGARLLGRAHGRHARGTAACSSTTRRGSRSSSSSTTPATSRSSRSTPRSPRSSRSAASPACAPTPPSPSRSAYLLVRASASSPAGEVRGDSAARVLRLRRPAAGARPLGRRHRAPRRVGLAARGARGLARAGRRRRRRSRRP